MRLMRAGSWLMWRGLAWFSRFCWEWRVCCSFPLGEGVKWVRVQSSGGVVNVWRSPRVWLL